VCTVSFIARRRGYLLAMNRDERLTRVPGLPPKFRQSKMKRIVCPSEPGGGTWIALNETGVTLALINWYSITARVGANAISRGQVVVAAGHAGDPAEVEAALEKSPLARTNPFRLIGIFPSSGEIVEWRWNLRQLVRLDHKWRTQQWISSGFDEPGAQRERSAAFRKAWRQKSAGGLAWLRRLHRSHSPAKGPFSTCMHRADAATVGSTEVAVSTRLGTIRHHDGPPCRQGHCSIRRLTLRAARKAT